MIQFLKIITNSQKDRLDSQNVNSKNYANSLGMFKLKQ